VSPLEYSRECWFAILGQCPEDATDVGYAAEAYSNIRLARDEYDVEVAAANEATMRHVRQTAGYQKYGAHGAFGGGK
jgi:hypothetical protein